MNADFKREDVRKALQLTRQEMQDVVIYPNHRFQIAPDPPLVGYTLRFKADTELTVTHLAGLAVVFGTHGIRVKYKPSELCVDANGSDYDASELTVEVSPDA